MSTKTPGQQLKETFNTFKGTTEAAWEYAAQAVLASHMPKISAEDVNQAIPSPWPTVHKHAETCKIVAERLNARLSHPQPAASYTCHHPLGCAKPQACQAAGRCVESCPVEWEEFTGQEARERGYKRGLGLQMMEFDGAWGATDTAEYIPFLCGIRYRRPKKINPQLEGAPPVYVSTPTVNPTPEAGAPSAESGETPETEEFEAYWSKRVDPEVNSDKEWAKEIWETALAGKQTGGMRK